MCLFQSKRNGKAPLREKQASNLPCKQVCVVVGQRCCCGGESGGGGCTTCGAAGQTPQVAVCLHSREEANGEEEIYDGKFAKAETRYGGTAAEFATIGETPFFCATLSTRPRSKIEAGEIDLLQILFAERSEREEEKENVFFLIPFFFWRQQKRDEKGGGGIRGVFLLPEQLLGRKGGGGGGGDYINLFSPPSPSPSPFERESESM